MRVVVTFVVLCVVCGLGIGCEKTIKDVRSNDTRDSVALSK